MTEAEIQALVGALAPVFKGYVESMFAPLQGRIAALEARAPAVDLVALGAIQADIEERYQRLAADLGGRFGTVLAPAIARVDQLEARALVPGPQGEPGAPGRDAPAPSPETVQAGIAQAVADQLGEVMGGPIQENVRGFIAECVTPLVIRVSDLEHRAPPPGPQGEPGAPGKDGRDAPALADLEAILVDLVKAIPPALAGKDGVGLAGAMVDRDGHLVVTLTNGEHKDLGPVIGRDGVDGKAGQDGFSLEDFSASLLEDGRTVLLKFKRGESQEVHELVLPIPIDRGVYKPGEYKRGDAVSWGGSIWIAQKNTDQAPEANSDWRLAVKRGRDGKDGVMKPDKPQGPVKVGKQ